MGSSGSSILWRGGGDPPLHRSGWPMTNVPLGPGGWVYEKSVRICVSGLGAGVPKTALQESFGEFGHIIKIETPQGAKGTAYISYQEKRDAQDAVKYMDGEKVNGSVVRVSLAGERPAPPPRLTAPPVKEKEASFEQRDDRRV